MDFTEYQHHLKCLNENSVFPIHYILDTDFPPTSNVILLKYIPALNKKIGSPVYFFVIKNDDGYFTSIVEMKSNDLVWYTLEEYRTKNMLANSLKNDILKFALTFGGWNGKITISKSHEFEASRRMALKVGFEKYASDSVSFDEYLYKF